MLTATEQKQLRKFEESLALPKWKYILFTGVLAWGILTALLFSVINMALQGFSLHELLRQKLWINLATFMTGGIFYGWWMHGFISRQAKKLREKEGKPE